MSGGHGITLTDGAYTGNAGDYPASDQIRQSYVWGNTQNGVDSDSDNYPAVNPGVGNWAPLWLVKERDFHLHVLSGYTPYTYPHPLRGETPPTNPEINIVYGAINIPDGNTYNFGFKDINSNTDQIFTLENLGTGTLNLSGSPIITITGANANQFSVQAQPTTPVAPSGNTTFTIRFTPTSLGAKVAAIAMGNDDPNENPYNITLNGTGSSGNYYVDQTGGNDTWDGLAPEWVSGTNGPWKTIAKVNGLTFQPGDTIDFKRGETWRETLTPPSSGTSGHPITFGAYGAGNLPKIYGSTAVATWTDEGSNLWYATLATDPLSVWFINTDTTVHWGKEEALKANLNAEYEWWWDGPNDRLYVYATSDPDTRYTSVENATRNRGLDPEAQSYITIQDIEVAYVKYYAIAVGSNCLIQRCTVHHVNIVGATSMADGIRLCNVSFSTVTDCDIYEIGRHGIYASATGAGTCSNNIIEHNIVHNCYHTLIDVMNVDGTASGNITRYNLLYTDSDYANASFGCMGIYYSGDTSITYPQANGEIYYNVSFNMFSTHIQIGAYTTGTQVLNNLCYGTNPLNTTLLANGIMLGSTGSTTITAKNNIVMDIYSGAGGGDACVRVYDVDQISAMDNNCWYQSLGGTRVYARIYDVASYHYDDLDDWQTAMSPFEASSLWEDPLFVNAGGDTAEDYKLTASSPCINAGVAVGLTGDYEGNSVPVGGTPDIGAYEYQGTSGAPEINVTVGGTNIGDGGSFDFGSKGTGTNTDQQFTLENLGDADLTLSGTPIITITGTNADQFSVQTQPTTPVAGPDSTTFTLRFSPTSSGAKVAAISIGNNDADENPYDISLAGTGAEPEINITDGTNPIADGGTFAFGPHDDGTNTPQVFTIENSGTVDLTLSGSPIITITGTDAGQFNVSAQPTTPIVASGNVNFTLQFSPTSPGAKTAAIAIGNNDSTENPYNIALTGTGLAVGGEEERTIIINVTKDIIVTIIIRITRIGW
jgi:parallel beta-helix repeat protein